MLDGYTWRREQEEEFTARMTANLMNIHLKRPVTIDMLLGRKKKTKSITKEEKQKELEEIRQMFKRG